MNSRKEKKGRERMLEAGGKAARPAKPDKQ